jgi:RNA polymerase sigma-70 factor (ECF subfamily)
MLEEERDRAVRRAIDSLSKKQRTALILQKYDELSQREIAEIMQISEGAVEQHLQRARQNLQKKLAPIVG